MAISEGAKAKAKPTMGPKRTMKKGACNIDQRQTS